eukprot:8922169-Heterocapsa_arctica.AAC.1
MSFRGSDFGDSGGFGDRISVTRGPDPQTDFGDSGPDPQIYNFGDLISVIRGDLGIGFRGLGVNFPGFPGNSR